MNNYFSNCPPLWTGGPDPAGYYSFPQRPGSGAPAAFATTKIGFGPSDKPRARSQYPITTGTSVFGVKYKDGVVLAADTLGSYGSLARFSNIDRVIRVNDSTVVACSGDYADFQYLTEVIEQKQIDEDIRGGGVTMKPEALHCWLTRLLYNRRSKFDPLWTTIVVGGIQNEKPFLGYVNYIGNAFTEDCIATGLGADVAVPLMRDVLEKKNHAELSLDEAKALIRQCLRVCFVRDCRASAQYKMAVVSKDGAVVEQPEIIDSEWEFARTIKGYE